MLKFKNAAFLLIFLLPAMTYSQRLIIHYESRTLESIVNSEYLESDLSDCNKYIKLRNRGIVMTVVGPPLIYAGLRLAFSGAYENDFNTTKFLLGFTTLAGGGILTGMSIPHTIIGIYKSHKYCNKSQKMMFKIGSQQNGVGLSVIF